MEKLGDRKHLILRIAITTGQNHQSWARSRKETTIQEDVACTQDVDVLRLQIRIGVKGPLVALVARMECPLGSNPAYSPEAC
jgi:hypothetical protein